jgi:hypothetical protein
VVASRWRQLLVTVAAVAVSCLVPGSMLTQTTPAPSIGTIVTAVAVPLPLGGGCAAVSCNRGSPSSPVPVPSLTLASTIAAGLLFVLALCVVRRARVRAAVLPTGSSSPLLRPPQHLISA